MSILDDVIWSAAVHEAGHAIVADRLGRTVEEVVLFDDAGFGAVKYHGGDQSNVHRCALEDAAIAWAGPCAEGWFAKRERDVRRANLRLVDRIGRRYVAALAAANGQPAPTFKPHKPIDMAQADFVSRLRSNYLSGDPDPDDFDKKALALCSSVLMDAGPQVRELARRLVEEARPKLAALGVDDNTVNEPDGDLDDGPDDDLTMQALAMHNAFAIAGAAYMAKLLGGNPTDVSVIANPGGDATLNVGEGADDDALAAMTWAAHHAVDESTPDSRGYLLRAPAPAALADIPATDDAPPGTLAYSHTHDRYSGPEPAQAPRFKKLLPHVKKLGVNLEVAHWSGKTPMRLQDADFAGLDDEGDDGAMAAVSAKLQGRRLGAMRVGMSTGLRVDEANGVIYGAPLMTIGAAKGHGFTIDAVTLQQLVALANEQENGVKCRFRHPKIDEAAGPDGKIVQTVEDDTGKLVARIKNARIEGDRAVGDIYLGSYAAVVPGQGDVREYLLRMAQDDPTGIGMSAFFEFHVEPILDAAGNVVDCPCRIDRLDAVDFTSSPAANENGMLSARRDTK